MASLPEPRTSVQMERTPSSRQTSTRSVEGPLLKRKWGSFHQWAQAHTGPLLGEATKAGLELARQSGLGGPLGAGKTRRRTRPPSGPSERMLGRFQPCNVWASNAVDPDSAAVTESTATQHTCGHRGTKAVGASQPQSPGRSSVVTSPFK